MRNHTHPFAINSLSNKQTGESHTHTYSRRLAHTLPHTHKQTSTHTHTGTLARYTHACRNTQSSFHYKTEVHRSSSSPKHKNTHTHTQTAWRWAGKTTKNRKILWQKLYTNTHIQTHTDTLTRAYTLMCCAAYPPASQRAAAAARIAQDIHSIVK